MTDAQPLVFRLKNFLTNNVTVFGKAAGREQLAAG